METAGIIAEFNPFHNGHKYLMDTVRRDVNPRTVVCIMSGNFVQRGMPSVKEKFARARDAVDMGADLVVELPAYCAVNSAREFAFGAVRTLASLGVTRLCFGSETGDARGLEAGARLLAEEPDSFSEGLKSALKGGASYPKAHAIAAASLKTGKTAGLSAFFGPNDILALEYIKQIIKGGFPMEVFAVKRVGAAHDSSEVGGGFASAGAIRDMLARGEDPSAFMPATAGWGDYACLSAMEGRMLDLLKYKISSSSAVELSEILDMSEGLENLYRASILKAESMDGLIMGCKSKRYTYARLSRIAVQILIGATKKGYEIFKAQRPYGKVLAFNENGAKHMARMRKKGVMVISNPNKEASLRDCMPEGAALDMRASEVYGILRGRSLYYSSDKVNIPKIIRQ